MSRVTIIDNEYLTLWYHPEKKIVHHKLHKFLFGKVLREGLDEGIKLLKEYEAQKWLSDDKNNFGMTKEDTTWTYTDWFPRAVQAGWKYWALVRPEKVIGQMSMRQIIKDCAASGVTVQVFSDSEAAMKWLEEQ